MGGCPPLYMQVTQKKHNTPVFLRKISFLKIWREKSLVGSIPTSGTSLKINNLRRKYNSPENQEKPPLCCFCVIKKNAVSLGVI